MTQAAKGGAAHADKYPGSSKRPKRCCGRWKLVIEEGPLGDWLYRNLSPQVDEMVVCDSHSNALICRDGDRSDALDLRKLATLYWS